MVHRIANSDRLCRLYKQMLELVGDLLHQDETFGSQADLSCVAETPLNTGRNGLRNIRIFTDDKWVGAPKSITVFLMTFPASEATADPAPTLPVTEAP
jgi:hypothetical protein